MNKFPFNLEAALAGRPCVTRDGRAAIVLCYDTDEEDGVLARVFHDGYSSRISCYRNGRYLSVRESNDDLFMTTAEDSNYSPTASVVQTTEAKPAIKPCRMDFECGPMHVRMQEDSLILVDPSGDTVSMPLAEIEWIRDCVDRIAEVVK